MCDWQLWGIPDGLSPSVEHIFWSHLNFLLISPALCLPTGEYTGGRINSPTEYKWTKGNLRAGWSVCSTAPALLCDLWLWSHSIILTDSTNKWKTFSTPSVCFLNKIYSSIWRSPRKSSKSKKLFLELTFVITYFIPFLVYIFAVLFVHKCRQSHPSSFQAMFSCWAFS